MGEKETGGEGDGEGAARPSIRAGSGGGHIRLLRGGHVVASSTSGVGDGYCGLSLGERVPAHLEGVMWRRPRPPRFGGVQWRPSIHHQGRRRPWGKRLSGCRALGGRERQGRQREVGCGALVVSVLFGEGGVATNAATKTTIRSAIKGNTTTCNPGDDTTAGGRTGNATTCRSRARAIVQEQDQDEEQD